MNLFSIKEIKELLNRHGFRFSKSLGQNFLTEAHVCESIVSCSEIGSDDVVLEIGPGIGSLTSELARSASRVVAVEIDKSLLPVLSETLSEYKNVKIINADILKCDIKKLVEEEFSGMKPKVCANLPYYITTPIISFLLESRLFSSITTMIQKEVAERICANHATSEYGAFSVFVQYFADPELLFKVSSDCFIPSPKVESAVIRLNIREKPAVSPESEELFFRVVKAAFAQRRKQLANSLFSAFQTFITKDQLYEIFEKLNLKATVRGEELSIEDFSNLSDEIYKIKESTQI